MSKKIEEGYLIPIIRIRIEKMTQLLREGMNVSEAAMQLGFSDIKNISRSFRQLKDITPFGIPATSHARTKEHDEIGITRGKFARLRQIHYLYLS